MLSKFIFSKTITKINTFQKLRWAPSLYGGFAKRITNINKGNWESERQASKLNDLSKIKHYDTNTTKKHSTVITKMVLY